MTPNFGPQSSQAGYAVKLSSWRGIQCLANRALAKGARHRRLTEVAWQASGRCQRPVTVQATGRKDDLRGLRGVGGTGFFREGEIRDRDGNTTYVGPILLGAAPMGSLAVTMEVRCRRCEACLRARGARWRDRAAAEVASGGRTWFGTLTLDPAAFARFEAKAQLEFSRGVEVKHRKPRSLDNWACGDGPAPEWVAKRAGSFTDWWKLPETERVKRVERTVYREVAAMLKRIRKQSGVTGLRFLCVFERENSEKEFFLHAHMLVHEPRGACLRYKDLKSRLANRLRQREPEKPEKVLGPQWGFGYTNWKLLPEGKVGYVTKYIAKCAATVVSSKSYGNGNSKPGALVALSASAGRGTQASGRTVATDPVGDGLTDRGSSQRLLGQRLDLREREDSAGARLGPRMQGHPSPASSYARSRPARDAAPSPLSPHMPCSDWSYPPLGDRAGTFMSEEG